MENVFLTSALEKLSVSVKASGAEKMVLDAVLEKLQDFCRQKAEFAQAIAESDRGLQECLDTVLKNHGSCLSDLEAYRRAVQFYFPGATVEMTLTVVFPGDLPSDSVNAPSGGAIILDLFDAWGDLQ